MKQDLLKSLPSVDELASALKKQNGPFPWPLLVRVARETIDAARERILQETWGSAPELLGGELAKQARKRLASLKSPIPVINATGVVLHTGLGRAPLSPHALDAVLAVARGYSTLEISRETGERQSRLTYVDELLRAWTGVPASTVVNNNAAAMFLCLHALARRKKVVIARAEMVEIGGSFRLPDILAASEVDIVEIGTTNKVRLSDYERVLDPETALIVKVHTSNYRIVGFTDYPAIETLAALGKKHQVPILFDVGSGAGAAWRGLIAPDEPLIHACLEAGVDLVSFSGDKLLGGPQAGILLGRADLIGKLKKNPLARAVRVDKMTLAALAATLELYLAGPEALKDHLPVYRMISDTAEAIKKRCGEFLKGLEQAAPAAAAAASLGLCETRATIGGGSVPGEEIPSWAVTLSLQKGSVDHLARVLRSNAPPVFGYIVNDRLHLDMRTVPDEDIPALAVAVARALASPGLTSG